MYKQIIDWNQACKFPFSATSDTVLRTFNANCYTAYYLHINIYLHVNWKTQICMISAQALLKQLSTYFGNAL